MRIKNFPSPDMDENCYVISSTATKNAVIIDPGAKHDALIDYLNEEELTTDAIVLTHGHYDHVCGVQWLRDITHAPVICGKNEKDLLASPNNNLSLFFGDNLSLVPDRTLDDNEEFAFGDIKFRTIFTPGHTPGGICLYFEAEKVLISGDTLFAMSVGRTDFPGGDWQSLKDSIINRILPLPDDTLIFPGHGPKTTIAAEKRLNPYIGG